MSRRTSRILSSSCGFAVSAVFLIAHSAFAYTPTVTYSGSQTGAFLSVDINGGGATQDAKPTEGFNENFSMPAFTPDTYGVTWAPWGGSNANTSQAFGDGTLWPQNNDSQAGTASFATSAPAGLTNNLNYFQKTFAPSSPTASASQTVTVAIMASGTPNQYNHATTYPISSRDLGPINGDPAANQNAPADFDIDMFRDFIFGYTTGSNVQGENYLQVQLSGLKPNANYIFTGYSYQEFSPQSEGWTTVAPTVSNNISGWWAASPQGNNTFTPPPDEQVITWVSPAVSLPGGPAVLNVMTDSTGTANIWTFGSGDGTPDVNAGNSFINGFQLGAMGDTNGDGVVNSTDFNTVIANLGTTVNYANSNMALDAGGASVGDFNNDGKVNQDDLALFMLGASEFPALPPAVPEPGNLVLIGLALVGLRGRRCQGTAH